jgi:gluconolactonase
MWNLSFTPPKIIEARVLTTMPDSLRRSQKSVWADANKAGQTVDSFLEGPCFDAHGHLYVTDIPHGRIFKINFDLKWECVLEYDGWPNGLAMDAEGGLWIADYKQGILKADLQSQQVMTVLGHRNSESFKGVNDLVFDAHGQLYFTDQGQTGLHDPTGRVYRYNPQSARLDLLFANAPSPNGIALNEQENVLFVAMTRANQVWRAPLLKDGSISKMGAFQTFFGTSGPDGLALCGKDGLVVAHASLGGAFVLNARGELTHVVRSPVGTTVTNAAFKPSTQELVMTESSTGTILSVDLNID